MASPHHDTDLAYAAGIVDGEGSISMTRLSSGGTWRIVLQVGSCDRDLVEWLHATFGGTVLYDRVAKNPNNRPHHRWTAASGHARKVLPLLLPFLRIKRDRAVWALEVLDIQAQRTGNGYYDDATKARLQAIRTRFDNDPRLSVRRPSGA